MEQILSGLGGWRGAREAADLVAQREVLAVLLERIVPVRVSHGQYRVQFAWTPGGDALRQVLPAIAGQEPAA